MKLLANSRRIIKIGSNIFQRCVCLDPETQGGRNQQMCGYGGFDERDSCLWLLRGPDIISWRARHEGWGIFHVTPPSLPQNSSRQSTLLPRHHPNRPSLSARDSPSSGTLVLPSLLSLSPKIIHVSLSLFLFIYTL